MGVVEDMLKEAGMEIKPTAEAAPDADVQSSPQSDTQDPPAPIVEEPAPAEAAPAATQPEIEDNVVLEALNKRLGTSFKSLEELEKAQKKPFTPEEEAAIAKERSENIVKFALDKGIYKSDDLSSYAIDREKPARQIALELFSEQMLKLKPELTPEEIEAHFVQSVYDEADDDSPLKRMKLAEMEQVKENYLKGKYSNILNAESQFDEYTSIEEKGRQYGDAVKSVMGEYGGGQQDYELSFNVAGVDLKWKAPADTIKAIEDNFLSKDAFWRLGAGELKKEELKESVKNALILKNLPKILTEVAESYHSAKMLEAGAKERGIPVRSDINSIGNAGAAKKELPSVVKEVLKGMPQAATA